jgi:hypothetical protein
MTARGTVDDWAQQVLIPPEAVEATLRIGVVGSADHCQFAFEIRNSSDGALLALESRPHAALAYMELHSEEFLRKLIAELRAHLVPF